MLAGRPPFIGDDTAALLYQVVHEEPPRLSNFVKSLPVEVERVVQRALTKDPAERFPNVTAFARAFEAAATGAALPAEPASDGGRGRRRHRAHAGRGGGDAGEQRRGVRARGQETGAAAGSRCWAGVAGAAIAGVVLVRGPLRRPPPAPAPAGAADAGAGRRRRPARASRPWSRCRPSRRPATPRRRLRMSRPRKPTTPIGANRRPRKTRARRRPARRAASAKQAATPHPRHSTAVKRKLINEL